MALRLQFIDTGEQLPLFLLPDSTEPRPRTRPVVTTARKLYCPVCGSEAIQEQCKVVCRSRICTYRIIYNCSEY